MSASDSSTEYKITYYKDSSAPKAPNASSGEKGCFIFDELTQISSLGAEGMEEYKHIMMVSRDANPDGSAGISRRSFAGLLSPDTTATPGDTGSAAPAPR